jgi:zinc protease
VNQSRLRRQAALALAVAFCAGALGATPLRAAGPDDVLRATLRNGLKVVIVHDPLAPVVTEELNYLVGSQDTPPGFPGMAHAEEHMSAGRSTRELSADQAATITTLLGGDSDAETQQTLTRYYITTPSDYLDVALRVEAARMRDTLNLQSEWAQERGAIEQEVSRDVSSAFYRYYVKALAVLFAGTPYAHDALGTRASFDKTTGPMLRAFWQRWYAPNNALLVIAGNVDPARTLSEVRSIFEGIPSRAVPAQPPVRPGPIAPGAVIHDDSDLPVPLALLAYRMPGFHSPDFAAAEIAADVLGSPRAALYGLQAEGKALDTGAEYNPFPESGIMFAYIATPPNGDTDAALKLLDATLDEYNTNGVPVDLVEAAKRREIAQLLYARDSIDGLATAWSDALTVQGLDSPDDAVAQYQKVTTADVQRALQTYVRRDLAVVGVLTPKPGSVGGGGSGALGGVRDTFASTTSKPVTLPSWAARLEQPPSIPASGLSPVDQTLPNGLRLIVQRETVSPTVTVRGEIKHNRFLQQPAGQEGVDDVLGGLFTYGTTSDDRLTFQKYLDEIAADVTAGTSFSLSVPSTSFDRGIQLLAANVLHPALPPAAFKIVQTQAAQGLAGEMQTPDYLAQRAMRQALLPAGDPALREATPQTVGTLTLPEVQAYHDAVFRPDMTTIVVAGDITPEAARASVEHWFGGWTASGPKPDTDPAPIPLNQGRVEHVDAPGRTQASVSLQENVAVRRTDPEYYALQLGDAVLGGSFYATRFWRDLRKDNGYVYNISAGVSASKTRGGYSVEYGSDPSKVAPARALIDRDLRDLSKAPPSATEMTLAKTQLVRELTLAEASVDAIAAGFVGRATAGLPLDEPERRARSILATPAERVRAAFAKYVDPARFVEIVVGPAAKK